jgi:putative hydrolase of the HAD superfamily
MLTTLRARGTRLALLTKGDPSVQSRRTQRSGLSDLFDIIEIVPEKSGTIIRELVARLGVEIDSAWMVGNSIRSDVIPAVDAGIRTVWIGAHVWEYERAFDHFPVDGVITASGLADIPHLIST